MEQKNTEAEGQKPEAPHGLFDKSNLTVNLLKYLEKGEVLFLKNGFCSVTSKLFQYVWLYW